MGWTSARRPAGYTQSRARSMLLIHCCLFFFQAEDGIRDLTVTGVQTCALPIFPLLRCGDIDFSYGQLQVLFGVDFTVREQEMVALLGTNGAGKSTLLRVISGLGLRSEERRVGKECRSRWSPYH